MIKLSGYLDQLSIEFISKLCAISYIKSSTDMTNYYISEKKNVLQHFLILPFLFNFFLSTLDNFIMKILFFYYNKKKVFSKVIYKHFIFLKA